MLETPKAFSTRNSDNLKDVTMDNQQGSESTLNDYRKTVIYTCYCDGI